MTDEYRDRVERRAYELWERDGRPEGQRDRHWAEAERQVAAEAAGQQTGGAGSAPGAGMAAKEAGATKEAGAAKSPKPARQAAAAARTPRKAAPGKR